MVRLHFIKKTIEKCENDTLKLVKCFNDLGVRNVNHAKINKFRHEDIFIENVKYIFYLFNCIFLNIGAKYATVLSQTRAIHRT